MAAVAYFCQVTKSFEPLMVFVRIERIRSVWITVTVTEKLQMAIDNYEILRLYKICVTLTYDRCVNNFAVFLFVNIVGEFLKRIFRDTTIIRERDYKRKSDR